MEKRVIPLPAPFASSLRLDSLIVWQQMFVDLKAKGAAVSTAPGDYSWEESLRFA